ncbi:MAG: ROK family protein, partial [Ignavibacteria bacterium]|nr:ROK family protein [Ignavibacteria bacterium]
MKVIALDIGGTKISSAIFDDAGRMSAKNFTLVEQRQGNEVGDLIELQIKKLLQSAKKRRKKISAIGISVPGIYWSKKGTVWAPNIAGWEDYPLLNQLNKFLKGENIKIKIESDRSCYILGEVWKGSAKGCKNAIFIAVGTGIGLGILAEGKIIRGANDIAGATGWMALNRPFKQEYISCGCFEYHASGNGIAKVAREYLKKGKIYFGLLKNKNPEEITSQDIFEAYEKSDAIAKR